MKNLKDKGHKSLQYILSKDVDGINYINTKIRMLNKIFRKKKKSNRVESKNIDPNIYKDFTEFENEIINAVKPFTMTSPERIKVLINSVEYINSNEIHGDFVECGVWKGGSSMVMAKTLMRLNESNRKIWLFDTFEGMSEPTEIDLDPNGTLAKERMLIESKETSNVWAYSPLNEVRGNLSSTGYPEQNVKFIKGKVEETLVSDDIPDKISLLRLDTDWYESTKAELEILFPKVVKNGVIIIDDYGHWQGCKKAVDEYIKANNLVVFLSRIDYTGRVIIKNF